MQTYRRPTRAAIQIAQRRQMKAPRAWPSSCSAVTGRSRPQQPQCRRSAASVRRRRPSSLIAGPRAAGRLPVLRPARSRCERTCRTGRRGRPGRRTRPPRQPAPSANREIPPPRPAPQWSPGGAARARRPGRSWPGPSAGAPRPDASSGSPPSTAGHVHARRTCDLNAALPQGARPPSGRRGGRRPRRVSRPARAPAGLSTPRHSSRSGAGRARRRRQPAARTRAHRVRPGDHCQAGVAPGECVLRLVSPRSLKTLPPGAPLATALTVRCAGSPREARGPAGPGEASRPLPSCRITPRCPRRRLRGSCANRGKPSVTSISRSRGITHSRCLIWGVLTPSDARWSSRRSLAGLLELRVRMPAGRLSRSR